MPRRYAFELAGTTITTTTTRVAVCHAVAVFTPSRCCLLAFVWKQPSCFAVTFHLSALMSLDAFGPDAHGAKGKQHKAAMAKELAERMGAATDGTTGLPTVVIGVGIDAGALLMLGRAFFVLSHLLGSVGSLSWPRAGVCFSCPWLRCW
jgi:hypothetical protein